LIPSARFGGTNGAKEKGDGKENSSQEVPRKSEEGRQETRQESRPEGRAPTRAGSRLGRP